MLSEDVESGVLGKGVKGKHVSCFLDRPQPAL